MPTPSIDLATVRLLTAVAAGGSIGEAAAALGISQQAASARVRAAERSLRRPLVRRGHAGSTLTADGALLVEWGVPLLAAEETFAASVATLAEHRGDTLPIAASQSIAEAYVPAWISAAHADLGPVAVTLASGNSAWVLDRVRAGEAAIGLVETPQIPSDVSATRIGTDDLVVAVVPGHAWARLTGPLPTATLAATPIVTREVGSGTRATLELAVERASGPPLVRPAAELSSTGAVRAAILGGLAAGVISRALIEHDLSAGRLVAVPTELTLSRPLTAVWLGVLSPPARRFLESLGG